MANKIQDRLLRITRAFQNAKIPHAIGGAIALAFYSEPRATADLDINVFLRPDNTEEAIDVLSSVIEIENWEAVAGSIAQSGQARVRWEDIPVDLFFSNTPFHDSCARRVQWVDYLTEQIPILSAEDLLIFKSAYDRPQDWLDIGKMVTFCGAVLDRDYVRIWAYDLFDRGDRRIARIEALLARDAS